MKLFLITLFSIGLLTQFPLSANRDHGADEVVFMRELMASINPSLVVEDNLCAVRLPSAIYKNSQQYNLDWLQIFVLAWQESDFDCHAKNKQDKGGAYGPFQIRRLWERVTGDPRRRYYDPDLAVERVSNVLIYYQKTTRYGQLVKRGFRNPLLCLYNTGEIKDINMTYCRTIGRKMEVVQKAWLGYRSNSLITMNASGENDSLID